MYVLDKNRRMSENFVIEEANPDDAAAFAFAFAFAMLPLKEQHLQMKSLLSFPVNKYTLLLRFNPFYHKANMDKEISNILESKS